MGFNFYLIPRRHFNPQVKALIYETNVNMSDICRHIAKRSNGHLSFDKIMFELDPTFWKQIQGGYELDTGDAWDFLVNIIHDNGLIIVGEDFEEKDYDEFFKKHRNNCSISENVDFD